MVHRNTVILITVLLFFIFFFYFHVRRRLSIEGFGDTYDTKKTNVTNLVSSVPMDLEHTNLKYYKDTWNNSLTIPSSYLSNIVAKTNCDWRSYVDRYSLVGIDTKESAWDHWTNIGKAENKQMDMIKAHTVINDASKEIIYWNDLPFDTNFPPETKLGDCSVSFWLYLNDIGAASPWQQILKISDLDNPSGSIGIWLWCCGKSCIHVLKNSEPLPINMNNAEKELVEFAVPSRRSVFCTLVFSGTSVVFFLNGVKKSTVQTTTLTKPYSTKRKTIEVGFANSKKSYALKDVNIYKNAMGDDTVSALYDRIKDNDRTTKAETFFSTESFSTMERPSSVEPFESSLETTLPSELILDNGKPFNFYSYQPIPLGNPQQTSSMANVPIPMSPQTIPKITLNKNDFNIPESMPLYYFDFDSSKKQYIDIPEKLQFNDKGCTFALWFKANGNNVHWTRLFDFGKNAGDDNIVLAFLNNSLQFYVFDGKQGKYQAENWAFSGATDNWYHVAWTMAPAPENVWKIYINGALYKTINNRNDPNSYEQITTPGSVSLSYTYGKRWSRRERRETLKTNSNDNILKIADMANTNIGYEAKVVRVAPNTRASLYPSTDFGGDPIVIEYPNSIGHLNANTVKSIKIEKIINQIDVVRTHQYIGRSNWYWDQFYSGSIGDFRIFSEVLDDEKIRFIYRNPKNPEVVS
jgi:hypothetical protein